MRQCAVHGEPEHFRRHDETNPSLVVHGDSGLTLFVYFGDDDDLVEAVELDRPEGEDVVTFRGVDLFGPPADEVVEALSRHAEVTVTEGGCSVTAASLFLGLWRSTVPEGPDDDEGRYFEAVLIAAPGYGE